MAGMQDLDIAVRAARDWIDDVTCQLGWHDHERAYLAVLAVLHALRDSLAQAEAISLGAQLPPLLRGLYYEGWHGARLPARTRAAFLERIHAALHRDPGIDAEEVARAVLALLAARLPAAELEEVRAATPKHLHNLWPS